MGARSLLGGPRLQEHSPAQPVDIDEQSDVLSVPALQDLSPRPIPCSHGINRPPHRRSVTRRHRAHLAPAPTIGTRHRPRRPRMVEKRLLCPNRRRRTPAQFSWLDHRLVRERRLESCPVEAWALYLFLVTVGDAQGLSYYCDAFPHRACAPRAPRASTRPLSPHRRRTHRLRAPAVSGPLARRRAPHPPRSGAPPLHGASARCCCCFPL